MADWTWHAFDLASGGSLGEVLMGDWSHEDRLRSAGSWNATPLPPDDDGTIDVADHTRHILNATAARRAVIVAVRTDDYGQARAEFTGWVPPGGQQRPDIAGTGLLGYYQNRIITTPLSFNPREQTQIPATIIDEHPGAKIDTATAVTDSGVQRVASWTLSDGKLCGEAMLDIAGRINGFEFDIRTELDAGRFVRRYRTWYPRRGAGFRPHFVYGGNMWSDPKPAGNKGFATRVIALGSQTSSGPPPVRLTAIRTNTALIKAGEPIIDIKLDRSDIVTQQALNDHADGALHDAARNIDDELTFDVDPGDPNFPYGSWDLGADCWVQYPAGRHVWWPDGLSELRRVVAHRWTVEGAVEKLEVVTGPAWGS